jgi:translation initiation factor IF-3
MDYGKFKYESALKARESRKNQAQTVIKEIKLRPKIDPHDYGTKKGHVERFLKAGDKVKVTIMFRGREQSRPELGFRLLQRLAGDVEELGFVETSAKQDGRNMTMVIGPHRKKSDARPERAPHGDTRPERAPHGDTRPERAPQGDRPAEPAPQAAEPAPQAAEPAPQAAEPAPQAAEPAPQAAEPAPQAAEPAPQAAEPAPQPAAAAPARPVPGPRAVHAAAARRT